jgi:hypothetical protein
MTLTAVPGVRVGAGACATVEKPFSPGDLLEWEGS